MHRHGKDGQKDRGEENERVLLTGCGRIPQTYRRSPWAFGATGSKANFVDSKEPDASAGGE